MADDQQLCKSHNIGDGGADEKSSSQSPPEKKQKLDEKSYGTEEEMEDSDGATEEEDDENDGTEEEDDKDDVLTSEHDPDVDSGGFFTIGHVRLPNRMKSDYLPDGVEEVDVDTWNKYYEEIKESGGFDIDHYPGCCIMSTYHPLNVNAGRQDLIDFCVAALNEFNQTEGTEFLFDKLEKANGRLWGCGANHYLTFRAKQSVADVFNTFQALVWWGIGCGDLLCVAYAICCSLADVGFELWKNMT